MNETVTRGPLVVLSRRRGYCGGEARFLGHRICPRDVIAYALRGEPAEVAMAAYPTLSEDEVRWAYARVGRPDRHPVGATV